MAKYPFNAALIGISILITLLSYQIVETVKLKQSKDGGYSLIRECDPASTRFRLENISPFSELTSVLRVQLVSCPLPKVSYKTVFSDLNIALHEHSALHLSNMTRKVRESHMDHLGVDELILENVTTDSLVLKPLTALKKLYVERGKLPPLPEVNEIQYVSVNRGTLKGNFGKCLALRGLIISYSVIKDLPDTWLSQCEGLEALEFYGESPEFVNEALKGVRTLTVFRADNCNLTEIPSELLNNRLLEELGLNYNNLTKLSSALKMFPFLQVLLLEANPFDPPDLRMALVKARALRSLVIRASPTGSSVCGLTRVHLFSNVTGPQPIGASINFTCMIAVQRMDCFFVLQLHLQAKTDKDISHRTWLTAAVQEPVSTVIRVTANIQDARVICIAVKQRTQRSEPQIIPIDEDDDED